MPHTVDTIRHKPTVNQPQVQDVLRQKHIDATNTAEMLKEFGGRTIINPFALQVA